MGSERSAKSNLMDGSTFSDSIASCKRDLKNKHDSIAKNS
jgi:hypothetical protein